MLREVHSHFIYLDTGVLPMPGSVLDEISRELGLPMQQLSVGLSCLEQKISAALETLDAQ